MKKAVIFDMYETLITHNRSPLYFGKQIAEDIGLEPELFYKAWHESEDARTRGLLTTEAVIESIMRKNGLYSKATLDMIMEKRRAVKRDCYLQLDDGIIPLLDELKKRKIAIGLISNCFSEEAEIIHESRLFPYFSSVMLSYEQKCAKPEKEIYLRCLKELSLPAKDCLFFGDGGSMELEGASAVGITAVQALWYINSANYKHEEKSGFPKAEKPADVLKYLD